MGALYSPQDAFTSARVWIELDWPALGSTLLPANEVTVIRCFKLWSATDGAHPERR